MNHPKTVVNAGEIDLLDLILTLWRKKWWIIVATCVFASLGATYSFIAQERWVSKAEIIEPRDYEMAEILKDRLYLSQIINEKLQKDIVLTADSIREELFQLFTAELRSDNARLAFFKQSTVYEKMTKGMADEQRKLGILHYLANDSIQIQWPNKKKNIDYTTITYAAESPFDAQTTLFAYLDYLNDVVFEQEFKNFITALDNEINALKFAIDSVMKRTLVSRNVQLEAKQKNLYRALSTAKAAGIKDFSRVKVNDNFSVSELELGKADIALNDDQLGNSNFLFLMGERYLQAQLDNVDKIPVIYPEEYYVKKTKLEQLESLKNNLKLDDKDRSFYYQSEPVLPLSQSKTKSVIIVLLAALVGFTISSLTVLLFSAIASRQSEKVSA